MGEPIAFPHEDPAFAADPYPFYRTLREQGPVLRVVTVRGLDAWLITRYEDGLAALSDPRFGSDLREANDPRLLEMVPSRQREFMRSMIRVDPPDHTRLRRLVARVFTPRRIAGLRPRVQRIADGLLDAVAPAGRADLVEDFALPLPVTVIGELLGVPCGDRDGFQEWTNVMLTRSPGDRTEVERAWRRMWSYLKRLLTAKRARPGDDVLSALVAARDEEGRLDEDELIAMALLLLVAGYVTTVNLIGGGIAGLLRHPAQLKLLLDDPALLPGAVEELLRYDGPVNPGVVRIPAEDVQVGGVTLPRGSTVIVGTALADRDPGRFADPDRLDIARADNAHLAFGHGVHYCLGAPLARLEGEIAIGTALRRLPGLALAVPHEELRWSTATLRGPEHLPVTFTQTPVGELSTLAREPCRRAGAVW